MLEKILLLIKTKKVILFLSIILILGTFLRLNDFGNLLRFNADQVRDMQIVEDMQEKGEFPLLGPKAGGTKFKLGPAFYYMEYASGSIFGFSPWGIALFIPILSTISIGLFYLIFKNIFSVNLALILTFLYSISFYDIKYSRFAWNPNTIPFFIFSFILLLIYLNKKKFSNYFFYALLGIVIGIGVQLHTTLLILLPSIFALSIIFDFVKNKNLPLKKIMLTVLISLALNFPFFYSDYINKGENIKQFIAGTKTKTGSSSIVENIASTSRFFLQGNIYALSGIEPQKNWTNLNKFIKSKNSIEYLLFAVSAFIFIAGIFALAKKIKKTRKEGLNYSLLLVITILLFSLLLFIPMGDELNLRFFIMIIFLPYFLLGLILEYAMEKFNLSLPKITIAILVIVIFAINISMFRKTYNLENYKVRESVYGGISLGEINRICSEIKMTLKNNPSQKLAFTDSFDFKRSIEYTCKKQNVRFETFSKEKTPTSSIIFNLSDSKNESKNISNKEEFFSLAGTKKIGRFSLINFIYNR